MASQRSSWEGWAPSWGSTATDCEAGDIDDLDYSNVSPDIAAEELASMLIDLKVHNSLSATQCCILAWWASKAGVGGRMA